jgi:peptidoglycan/xylan/chitin deacetylase (PgdA/CDA1 family)
MYIGSVRFFKHLILTVIALLIIIPTLGCVYFAVQYHSLKTLTYELRTSLQAYLIQEDEQPSGEPNDNLESRKNDAFAVYASEQIPESEKSSLLYQNLYPQLCVENDFQYITETENTAYLTFDDGPTGLTPQVLDILKNNGIQATFFVVYKEGKEAEDLYKRMVYEGHTLAVHSASHDYKKIYQSVEAFLDDFAVISDMLEDITGAKPEIFRFPGGSINNYNKEIHQELVAEMLRRGYTYYDWDVSSGSSTNTASRSSIYSNVLNGISGKKQAIILMHDAGTSATVAVLPDIINSLKASGYKFEVLNKKIRPACFDYTN